MPSHIIPSSLLSPFEHIAGRFHQTNRRGLITIAIIGIMGVSAAGYIASVYRMANLGFEIQKETKSIKELQEQNLAIEVNIQKRDTTFAEIHKEMLSSMEKISTIKYLTADSVVMKR